MTMKENLNIGSQMVMPSFSALLSYPTRQHLSNVRPFSQSKLFHQLNQKPAVTFNDMSLIRFTHTWFMFIFVSASIKPNLKTRKKTYQTFDVKMGKCVGVHVTLTCPLRLSTVP